MRLLDRIRKRPRPLQEVGAAAHDVASAARIVEEIGLDVATVVDRWRADGVIVAEVILPGATLPIEVRILIAQEPAGATE